MLVALHDGDHTRFPNLVLMKLSAWHKAQGDKVVRYLPLFAYVYDRIYSSKVFSWTPEEATLPNHAEKGGTGYGLLGNLPDEIEHAMPDYSLYPVFKASLGFTTRGCARKCPWCIVPEKEGMVRPHAHIEEFLRTDSRELVLMDNNILAHPHGIGQLEQTVRIGLKVDCNQGLDARLIADDDGLANLLSRVSWLKGPRLACDSKSQMEAVEKAVLSIRKHGGKRYAFSCYVLVKDIPDALERVEFLRKLGVDAFAQPYRPIYSRKEPDRELRRFARWVNHKAIFKSVSWEKYGKAAKKQGEDFQPLLGF